MKKSLAILAILALPLVACERQDKGPPTPQATGETAPPAAGSAPSGPQGTAAAPPTAAGQSAQAGEQVYKEVCATCHDQGIAGAPKTGDKEAWASRLAKGRETLVRNSVQGFQGSQGVMPPKGGVQSLTEDEVAAAVDYMIRKSS